MGKALKRGLLRLVVFIVVCLLMGVVAGVAGIHLGDASWTILVIVAVVIYYIVAGQLVRALKLQNEPPSPISGGKS